MDYPVDLEPQRACAGFQRPSCEPCINEDVIKTRYDSMGEIITANLCEKCHSYLLKPGVLAWE